MTSVARRRRALIVLACVVAKALAYVIGQAPLAALLGRKTIWQRTDKLRRPKPRFAALQGAGVESTHAVSFTALAVLSMTTLPTSILSVVMAYGFLTQTTTFAAAPALSYLSARKERNAHQLIWSQPPAAEHGSLPDVGGRPP